MYSDFDYMGYDFLISIISAVSTVLKIISFVTLFAGAFQCFFGYKLLHLQIIISGFLTGCVVGAAMVVIGIVSGFMEVSDINEFITLLLFFMIISGIIGGVIARSLYDVGVFLIGFSTVLPLSLITSFAAALAAGKDNLWGAFISALIPAIIAGVIVVKFEKPIIIIATSFSGALLIGFSLNMLISLPTFLGFIGFIIGGIYYQCKSNNGLRENYVRSSAGTYASNRENNSGYSGQSNGGALHYQPLNNNQPKADSKPAAAQSKNKSSVDLPEIID